MQLLYGLILIGFFFNFAQLDGQTVFLMSCTEKNDVCHLRRGKHLKLQDERYKVNRI